MSQNKKPVLVLLADDNTSDQDRMMLALNGAETELKIDLVDNGIELLDFLLKQYSGKDKQLPDLIITDLYMPFAGGLHVLKQIRKREEFKQIPIYVFSANNDNMIRAKVLEHGATEFHQKPADFTSLQNIVQGILSRSQPVLLA